MKLLNPMSYGRKYDYKEFIASMNDLANKSPDDAVKKLAKVQLEKFLNSDLPRINTDTVPADSSKIIYNLTEDKLAVIGQPKDSAKAVIAPISQFTQPKDTAKSPYKFDFSTSHSYIIILNQEVSSSNIMNGVSNYNTKNFATLNLKITPITMSNKTILMIQSFTDGSKAGFYDKFLKNEKGIFDDLKKESYALYSISNANLTLLITTKDLAGYAKFYVENYK
ncbi:MAG: hypothetical protein IPK03_00160 [Bacteroidetes bacterium]|nr:hypothetical protein [Bacteroidota bacterium]